MSATNFNTRNDTFRKLLGNGLTYRVPRFQRDYSWGEDEWDDLWQDLLGTIKEGGEPAHYMGYLVLQTSDDKIFDVIDGQQRLTTLSLIILAALKNLQKLVEEGREPEKSQRRLDQIRQTYIGYLDPVTLVPRSKLALNRNNDAYYQSYLVPLVDKLPQRGFKASEHALRKAFEFFERKIREYARSTNAPDTGQVIAGLIDMMSDRLFFTVITVNDELNAYRVFETLNARGVRLSSTDLLKNYLFSVIHRGSSDDHEMKTLEDRWELMVGRLGEESFPDFLRTHWNSRHGLTRQSELFKTIRRQVQNRESVFALLREMDEDIETYLALTAPENSSWPQPLKKLAADLQMLGMRQPFAMLLAARRRLNDTDFERVLNACFVISFRYNVICGMNTSDQEQVYHQAAALAVRPEPLEVSDIFDVLKRIYPADAPFKVAFAEKSIRTSGTRNKKLVRYILCALEHQLSGKHFDFESPQYNIEHILPMNPEEGWETFRNDELAACVDRLGNMAMLETKPNRTIGNADFASKRAIYQESSFELTRKIASDNDDWTPARLAARQQSMANLASTVWRVNALNLLK